MLVRRPSVVRSRPAPRLQQRAVRVELQHRRRRHATRRARRRQRRAFFVVGERLRALHDPHVIVTIDRDAGRLADEPPVRQRLRPCGIHLELRGARRRVRQDGVDGHDRGARVRGDGERRHREQRTRVRRVSARIRAVSRRVRANAASPSRDRGGALVEHVRLALFVSGPVAERMARKRLLVERARRLVRLERIQARTRRARLATARSCVPIRDADARADVTADPSPRRAAPSRRRSARNLRHPTPARRGTMRANQSRTSASSCWCVAVGRRVAPAGEVDVCDCSTSPEPRAGSRPPLGGRGRRRRARTAINRRSRLGRFPARPSTAAPSSSPQRLARQVEQPFRERRSIATRFVVLRREDVLVMLVSSSTYAAPISTRREVVADLVERAVTQSRVSSGIGACVRQRRMRGHSAGTGASPRPPSCAARQRLAQNACGRGSGATHRRGRPRASWPRRSRRRPNRRRRTQRPRVDSRKRTKRPSNARARSSSTPGSPRGTRSSSRRACRTARPGPRILLRPADAATPKMKRRRRGDRPARPCARSRADGDTGR